jgi:hypothetical protein
MGEIVDRGEDAAMDEVAFDLAEPELDLVEPGGVGRGEVEMYVGPLLDATRLMRGEVVEDDVEVKSRSVCKRRSGAPRYFV